MAQDSLGNPISRGDVVVYPTRQGSNMRLEYGVVENSVMTKNWQDDEIPQLKIRKFTRDWSDWRSDDRKMIVKDKLVTLQIVDRTTVITSLVAGNEYDDVAFAAMLAHSEKLRNESI